MKHGILGSRRAVVAGCMAGFMLCGAGVFSLTPTSALADAAKPVAAIDTSAEASEASSTEADAEQKYTPLVTYDKKTVIYKGLSFELPDNVELSDDLEDYTCVVDGDIVCMVSPQKVITESDSAFETAKTMAAEDYINLLDIDGFTTYGAEEFQNETVKVIAAYCYMDSKPEINEVVWQVIGDDSVWLMQAFVASRAKNDEAAIDVARQIAMSMEVDQAVTQGKKALIGSK